MCVYYIANISQYWKPNSVVARVHFNTYLASAARVYRGWNYDAARVKLESGTRKSAWNSRVQKFRVQLASRMRKFACNSRVTREILRETLE